MGRGPVGQTEEQEIMNLLASPHPLSVDQKRVQRLDTMRHIIKPKRSKKVTFDGLVRHATM
jgi:hypothetical protein